MQDNNAKMQYKPLTTALMAEYAKYIFSFVITAKVLNISKAAAELGINPATLSRQLTRYERSLGIKLLERNNKKITLTEKGKNLLELVEPAYDSVWAATEMVRDKDHAIALVRFGFPISLSAAIPELIKGLQRNYPQVRIELFPGHGNQLLCGVKNADLDLAIVAPLPKELGDLAGIKVGEQYLDFIHHDDIHPWKNATMIHPQEIKNIPFIAFPSEFWIRRITDQILASAGVSLIPVIESTDIETVIGLVSCGIGGAIIPRQKERQVGISYKVIDSPYAQRSIGMIYRNSAHQPNQAIYTYIHAYLTEWLTFSAIV